LYAGNNEHDTTSKVYNLLAHPGWSVHWLKFSNDIGVFFPFSTVVLTGCSVDPKGSASSFHGIHG